MKVYKLTLHNSSLLVPTPSDLLTELDAMEEGDEFKVTCEEISEEDFANLPEFEGF